MHDFRVIGLDKTSEYTIVKEDQPHIKRIIEVYAYDSPVHDC